jgi:AraC-type DNA-binding domain-containing proteins
MYEWNEAIQKMLTWIEEHLTDEPTLGELSRSVGYSPYYCSVRFHEYVGMTLRSYVCGRRLARAALDLRDTNSRVIDIAVKYGFSSQEALTRAFGAAFGLSPAAYRKNPLPIALACVPNMLYPEFYEGKGDAIMSVFTLKQPEIKMEFLPAHKYLGIWDDTAEGYGSFWDKHDCDRVCGTIESMRHISDPVVGCHMAGWRWVGGKRKYFYGLGVSADYDGPIPEGFELKSFPASYYLVFFHPTFDYLNHNGEVMGRVEDLAWNYDIKNKKYNCQDYDWNEDECQIYQRHYPEVLGYEVLRPVKRRQI